MGRLRRPLPRSHTCGSSSVRLTRATHAVCASGLKLIVLLLIICLLSFGESIGQVCSPLGSSAVGSRIGFSHRLGSRVIFDEVRTRLLAFELHPSVEASSDIRCQRARGCCLVAVRALQRDSRSWRGCNATEAGMGPSRPRSRPLDTTYLREIMPNAVRHWRTLPEGLAVSVSRPSDKFLMTTAIRQTPQLT
jgi:hypothetical protein